MANIIEMPKLSDTMTVGTLVRWLKKEGDPVKSGEILAEVETDKATMELESFFDGELLAIFVREGTQVAIGEALCAIGKHGEEVSAPAAKAPPPAPTGPEAPPPSAAPAAAPSPSPAPAAAPRPTPAPATVSKAPPATAPRETAARFKISPLARRLAAEKGVDPARIAGSGPGGRIVRADVVAAAASGGNGAPSPSASSAPAASRGPLQDDKVVPVSNVRGTIARRLLESKTQVPHYYLDIEVDAGPLLEVREQLNAALEKEGVKLSVNDFVLKASAEALRRVPAVNSSWEGSAIRYYSAAHVSFAVAIDDGLITPVVRDAHLKTIFAISSEAKALGMKAKAKKLAPEEFTGGTFCVTNLGMMGIDRFCAIINPPNAAILAVGTIVRKPTVKDGIIVIGQRMTLTLSGDHRVVDGAVGAAYLSALRDLLEKPALLLI
ncbi:MAG TPA: pyruvate dehydrogenase complex dihydrolipoamide acetyltransferase [Opitutaceae bacterium]|nr:pyruvate dehydrogenase complex dihydrolipoamide acetyltransferase [Opitutaceae bacterium]